MSQAIGKLLDYDSKKLVGTAFAVSKHLALTAFHCVGDCDKGYVRRKQVLIEFLTGDQIVATCKDEDGSGFEDYAILSLESPLPDSLTPIPLINYASPHDKFRAGGFPSAIYGTDHTDTPDIFWIDGEVTATETSILDGVPAIQLYANQSTGGLSLYGMSGAPVLVGENPESESAVGLVRWNYPQKDEPELAAGGAFWACPIEVIVQQHPDLSYLSKPSPSAVSALQKAEMALCSRDFQNTETICRMIIDQQSDHPKAHLLMAIAMLRGQGADRITSSTINSIEAHLEKAINDPSCSPTAWAILGIVKYDYYLISDLAMTDPSLQTIKNELLKLDFTAIDPKLLRMVKSSEDASKFLGLVTN